MQNDELGRLFFKHFTEPSPLPIQYYFAPGRVNLIGEHIDYNGGQVLPIAIGKGISAAVRPNNSRLIRIHSTNAKGELHINLDEEGFAKRPIEWMNYPLGVVYTLWKRQQHLKSKLRILENGFDMLLSSDLPMGSGLSSSAALEVVVAYVLFSQSYQQKLDNYDSVRVTLALLCQKAENNFVGVPCGIMDQFAVAMSKQNHAVLLQCPTLQYQYVPFDLRKYQLLVLDTNKPRQLTDSKYHQRKAECDAALALLQQQRPIKHLCEATLNELNHLNDPILHRRARHVVTENIRVSQTAKALIEGNWTRVGELFNESHHSLATDYEVTGFELDTLTHIARQTNGCIGARMTGAGFGGCAIALVDKSHLADFKISTANQYLQQTQLPLNIYNADPHNGVQQWHS